MSVTPGSGPVVVGVDERSSSRVRVLAPWVKVTTEISLLKPSLALLDASQHASCVVVGARRHGPLVGALLGTTPVDVAAHAACPVVVVREFPEVQTWRLGVVVGADGSELSSQAIGYAFAQAADRELPVTVVHVWSPEVATDAAAITEQERALAAEAVAGWAQTYPDVKVNRQVLQGHPVKTLVDHSHGADLLVVGSRGRGGFAGMVLGSVSQGVLQHAHCPVAVVRSGPVSSVTR